MDAFHKPLETAIIIPISQTKLSSEESRAKVNWQVQAQTHVIWPQGHTSSRGKLILSLKSSSPFMDAQRAQNDCDTIVITSTIYS